MKAVYTRPSVLKEIKMHYCPGCGHGIVHRILSELIEELSIRERTIIISPVGCSVLIYDYIDCDSTESAHGRAQAVATGLKRAMPDRIVISYQGDGDLAAIGMAETVHAANRGENFTVVFINNAIYGMTGGQMAPTTIIGQKTKTTPFGRDPLQAGEPVKMCELLSRLDGPAYIERVSIHDVKNIIKTKKAIRKALKCQIEGLGYSFVEVLSTCPTNWGIDPVNSMKWVEENMLSYYPLGVFKDRTKKDKPEMEVVK